MASYTVKTLKAMSDEDVMKLLELALIDPIPSTWEEIADALNSAAASTLPSRTGLPAREDSGMDESNIRLFAKAIARLLLSGKTEAAAIKQIDAYESEEVVNLAFGINNFVTNLFQAKEFATKAEVAKLIEEAMKVVATPSKEDNKTLLGILRRYGAGIKKALDSLDKSAGFKPKGE